MPPIDGSFKMDDIFFSYAGTDIFSKVTAPHAHRGFEMIYVKSGECVMNFESGESVTGIPGSVFIIPPHARHERSNPVPCETFYVVFERNDEASTGTPRRIDTGEDLLTGLWFHSLALLNDASEPEQAAAILTALLLRLEKFELRRRNTFHTGLQKALDYLESHCGEALSVSDLARHAGVSQSHLNALFRRETGHGALHSLLEARMRLARRLLLNPYYNISEAALRCGIPDSAYFTRCFKSFHGVTPGVYRNNPAKFADTENRR